MTVLISSVRFVTSHAHTRLVHKSVAHGSALLLTAASVAFIPVPVARPTVQMPPMLNANVYCMLYVSKARF